MLVNMVGMLRRQCAYTVVEMLCVLIITGVLLALGTPDFLRLLRQHRLSATVNDFHAALMLARSEALRRGVQVHLLAVGGDSSSDWSGGWIVLVDRNGDFKADAGDELIQSHGPAPADVAISASLSDMKFAYLAYAPSGNSRASSGGAQYGSWLFRCGDQRRKLVLNIMGRARSCNPDQDKLNC
jgi:type IV fimbrial biogenesis protein FimT